MSGARFLLSWLWKMASAASTLELFLGAFRKLYPRSGLRVNPKTVEDLLARLKITPDTMKDIVRAAIAAGIAVGITEREQDTALQEAGHGNIADLVNGKNVDLTTSYDVRTRQPIVGPQGQLAGSGSYTIDQILRARHRVELLSAVFGVPWREVPHAVAAVLSITEHELNLYEAYSAE